MSSDSSFVHAEAVRDLSDNKTSFALRFAVSAIGMSVFFVCAGGLLWGVGRLNALW